MNNKIRNWIAGILALFGVGMGAVYTTNQLTSEKVAVVKPVITITTSDSKPLVFSAGSNWVDIGFLGGASKNKVRNLADTNFLKLNRALGFQRGVYPAYGSIAQYIHFVAGSVDKGYNMVESDFDSPAEYRTYADGVAIQNWAVGFATTNNAFRNDIPVVCDLVLNPQHGKWAESKMGIDLFNPEYIGIGCEGVTGEMSIDAYKAVAIAWRDSIAKYFPAKKVVFDAGRIDRENPRTIDWNKMIASLNGKYIRQYFQVGDRVTFTANQDSNLIRVCYYYDTIIPKDFDNIKKTFGDIGVVGGEFMNQDNRGGVVKYIDNMPVGNYSLGRMYQMFIERQDVLSAAYWMALKNLIDAQNVTNVNYTTLSLLNSILSPTRNVTKITFNYLDGVSGVSLSEGKTNYMLINNKSDSTYTLTKAIVDGTSTNSKVVFTTNSQSANSWYSDVVYSTVTSTGTYTINPRSVSVISFTKN